MTKSEKVLSQAEDALGSARAKLSDLRKKQDEVRSALDMAETRRQDLSKRAVLGDEGADAELRTVVIDKGHLEARHEGFGFAIADVEAEIRLRENDVAAAKAALRRLALTEAVEERVASAKAMQSALAKAWEAIGRYRETGKNIARDFSLVIGDGVSSALTSDLDMMRAMPMEMQLAIGRFRTFIEPTDVSALERSRFARFLATETDAAA